MKRLVRIMAACGGLVVVLTADRSVHSAPSTPTAARPTPVLPPPGLQTPSGKPTAGELAERKEILATGRPEKIDLIANAPGVIPLKERELQGEKLIHVPLSQMLTFLRGYCKPRWYGMYSDLTSFSKWGFERRQCRFTKHEGAEALEVRYLVTIKLASGVKIVRTRHLYATTGKGALLAAEHSETKKGTGRAKRFYKLRGRWMVTRYYQSAEKRTEIDTKPLPVRPSETLQNGELAVFAWLARGKVKAGDGFRLRGFDPSVNYSFKPVPGRGVNHLKRRYSFQVLAVASGQGVGKSQTWTKGEFITTIGTASRSVRVYNTRLLINGQGHVLLMRSHKFRHRWETETEARWVSESLSSAQVMFRVMLKKKLSEMALQGLYRLDLQGLKIFDYQLKHINVLLLLEELNLDRTPIGDKGLEHLTPLKRLQVLRLQGTKVTAEGVRKLQQALPGCKIHFTPPSPSAKLGKLPANATATQRLAHWLKSHGVDTSADKVLKLYDVQLKNRKIGDADLPRLQKLTELHALNLTRTQVTDAGLAHLQALPKLSQLTLTDLDITNEGLKRLIPIGAQLTVLYLDGTLVTNAGLKHLTGFRKLVALRLPVQISEAALKRLEKKLPKCTVTQELAPSSRRKAYKVRAKHSPVTGCQWRLPLGSILAPAFLLFCLLGLLNLVRRPGPLVQRLLRRLLGARPSRVLLALGVLGLLMAGVSAIRPSQFLSQARTTRGTVVQIRRTTMTGCMGCSVAATRHRAGSDTLARTNYSNDFDSNFITVRFRTKAGGPITFQSRVSGDKLHMRLGSRVSVLYTPGAPRRAMLAEWWSYLLLFLPTGLVGIVSLLLLVAGLRRTSRPGGVA